MTKLHAKLNLAELSCLATKALKEQGIIGDCALDVELLLARAINRSRVFIKTWPEKTPSEKEFQCFYQLFLQRKKHVPIAYLLGKKEFWSLEFKLNAATLIPRAETEKLVEYTLDHFAQNECLSVLDLGAGSGAIAVSLKYERPNWQVSAIEKSVDALNMARINAENLLPAASTINFFQGCWFDALPTASKFDCIVSNPPYVEEAFLKGNKNLAHEPKFALAAGEDGLLEISKIIKSAKPFLKIKGLLIIEHGSKQAKAVADLMNAYGFKNVITQCDDNALPRLTLGINK